MIRLKLSDLPVGAKPRKPYTKIPKQRSAAEERLDMQLRFDEAPPFVRNFKFHNERKWQADFAWPLHKLLVEVEGITHEGGRHQRKQGFENDAEKYSAANKLGYEVLRFTPKQVRSGDALQTIHRVLARRQVQAIAGDV